MKRKKAPQVDDGAVGEEQVRGLHNAAAVKENLPTRPARALTTSKMAGCCSDFVREEVAARSADMGFKLASCWRAGLACEVGRAAHVYIEALQVPVDVLHGQDMGSGIRSGSKSRHHSAARLLSCQHPSVSSSLPLSHEAFQTRQLFGASIWQDPVRLGWLAWQRLGKHAGRGKLHTASHLQNSPGRQSWACWQRTIAQTGEA